MTDEEQFDIEVHIRRASDGEVRIHKDEYGNNPRYQWGDGNYSCDCNRYLFFERAGGRSGDDDPLDDDRGCSEADYVVERIVRAGTGEVLIEGDPRS